MGMYVHGTITNVGEAPARARNNPQPSAADAEPQLSCAPQPPAHTQDTRESNAGEPLSVVQCVAYCIIYAS
eukprot:m.963483 g.963483  ORF g.963483 m.963483 type:complete len:71 (+) comp23895_c0_seq15:2302-2514(+)